MRERIARLWTMAKTAGIREHWGKILNGVDKAGANLQKEAAEYHLMVNAVNTKHVAMNSRANARKVRHIEKKADTGDMLNAEEATSYRAMSARANYLAQDGPDIGYACKELCREFGSPTDPSVKKLTRMANNLVGCPRMVTFDPWGRTCKKVVVCTDTDYAGCKVIRLSTGGGVAPMGGHCVKSSSSTQSVLTLSSGEAELVGLTKGIAYGIGIRSLCADLGFDVAVEVRADAPAAIGMASRRETGEVRHLDVSYLWVQERIRAGDVMVTKVAGKENQADIMTKHVPRDTIAEHMERLTMHREAGRAAAAAAPELTIQEETEQQKPATPIPQSQPAAKEQDAQERSVPSSQDTMSHTLATETQGNNGQRPMRRDKPQNN